MRKMVLGTIPTLDYACAESINTLATNITFSGSQYKSVMITSCVANEGKSYIAFHLARTLGNMGYRTALVDADLRKSIFFSRYDAQIAGPRVGLTHYLAGRCEAEDALYSVNLPNLYVVPTGKEVINSLPLLTSTAFSQLLENMKRSFDFIIVDAPPIGLLIDAAMIASSCDATVLVVTNDISKRELIDAVTQIQKSKCTILGAVLNKVTMETHKSRKYYYKSYYSHYGSAYEYKENDEDDTDASSHKKRAGERHGNKGEPNAAPRSAVPPVSTGSVVAPDMAPHIPAPGPSTHAAPLAEAMPSVKTRPAIQRLRNEGNGQQPAEKASVRSSVSAPDADSSRKNVRTGA